MLDRNSLIEKFVVMGIDSTKDTFTYANILDDQVHPTFLDIFPFEQQETPSYLDNFKLWCFPDGIQIYNENLQKINGMAKNPQAWQKSQSYVDNQGGSMGNIMGKNQLHHFVLTNQNTEKKYCSCLMIHEEVFINPDDKSKGLSSTIQMQNSAAQRNFTQADQVYNSSINFYSQLSKDGNLIKVYVPKIICLISNCPVLEFQKQFLAFVYKFTITSKLIKQPPRLKVYQHLFERFTSLLGEEGNFPKAEKRWDEQVFQQTLDYLQMQPAESEVASQIKLKEEFLINFSVSMLFRVHTLQNLCSKNTEIIFNLSNEEVCRLRPFNHQTQNNFFTMNNFSFRPLFEKISIKTTIVLLQSILLERQILLVSSSPNEIISICESLFTLIYPLKWACIYIPLLPLQLSEMISAMMPYIIGISKKNYDEIKNKVDLKDKVIIDLDNDQVSQVEIHKLPEYLSMYLMNNFKELAKKFFASKNEDQKKKNAWFEVIFQLKKIFLNFMTCLINNISPFFLYSNKFDKDNVASRDIFAKSEYVQIFEQNEKSFMTELCQNTMMFSKFLEDSYRILYVTEFKKEEIDPTKDDKEGLYFFLKNIKKIQKSLPKSNSEKKFDIILSPLIFSSLDYELTVLIEEAISDYQNPKIIDLTPHLIKYLKFIENKNPEPTPQYQQGSIKQINYSKQVFKKLEKEWLMPIPKPVIPQPAQKLQEITNQDQKGGYQSNNNTLTNNNNNNNGVIVLDDSMSIINQSSDNIPQSLQTSIQHGIKSSQHLGQQSNNTTFIAPKENYKDPYYVSEHYQEPQICQPPILFFKNSNMEYDSWHDRQFYQEFDRINLEFPLKRQNRSKFDIFKAPDQRPFVRNIEDMIYMQDILAKMINDQQNKQQQQNQIKQNYLYSHYQHPSQETTQGKYQQAQSYEDYHYFSQKGVQPNHIPPANPNYNKINQNNTTPLYNQAHNPYSQQNLTQNTNYNTNVNTTEQDQLSSNRQSRSLAQLRMKNIMQNPSMASASSSNIQFNNKPLAQNQQFINNNLYGQENQQQNMPQIQNMKEAYPIKNSSVPPLSSGRSRTQSMDINPLNQYDVTTKEPLQSLKPQKYNGKLLPPSLDQNKRLPQNIDQLNIPKAVTTNNRNTKRLSIFQANTTSTKNMSNMGQLQFQKENTNQLLAFNENNLDIESKENQQPEYQTTQQKNTYQHTKNNENINANNTSITSNAQMFSDRNNNHLPPPNHHHQKNPSWSGSINFNGKQDQFKANSNLRQFSSKQPARSIFN